MTVNLQQCLQCNVHIKNVYLKSAFERNLFRLTKVFACKHTLRLIFFFGDICLNCINRSKHLLITLAFSEAFVWTAENMRFTATGNQFLSLSAGVWSAKPYQAPSSYMAILRAYLDQGTELCRDMSVMQATDWLCSKRTNCTLGPECMALQIFAARARQSCFACFFHLLAAQWCVSLCV